MKMLEDIKIREMKIREISKLMILMKRIIPSIKFYPRKNLKTFLRDYSKKHLMELYKHKGSVFLIAEEGKNNKPVGFLFGWDDYGVFWIDWLGVIKHKRRNHIATELLKLAEKMARKKGCHKMWLDTSYTNFPAISFYKKQGYFIEGRLKKHWLKWNYDLISKYLK